MTLAIIVTALSLAQVATASPPAAATSRAARDGGASERPVLATDGGPDEDEADPSEPIIPEEGSVAPDAGPAEPEPCVVGLPPAVPPPVKHFDWLVLPLADYDSDYGLGYGAGGQFQWVSDVAPYSYQLNFQLLFTTGGLRSHWLNLDVPHVLGSKFRFWAHGEYAKEGYAPYYGPGNQSNDTLEGHPGLYGPHAFTYDRNEPLGRLGFSYPLLPHLYGFLFTTYDQINNQTYAGSLLAEQQPYGIAGGHELRALGGFYYDTRDREAVPSRGVLLELSGRGESSQLGSSYTYGGVTARALGFHTLNSRMVLALRLEGDLLSHGAPFFALNQFGGADAIEGIGGQFSARGIPQDRYIGQGKAIGTAEVRLRLANPIVRGEPLGLGMVGYVDAGRVWQFQGNDGPWYLIHTGYGAGIRAWRREFVLRVDVATSAERPFNIYLLFGHFF